MIFVGMDVHVRNSFLHATDAEGRRLAHGRRANTAVDLGEFCDRVLAAVGGRLQPMRVVLENTTNSRAIQQMVCRAGQEAGFDTTADVLDARKLRIIAESVCKCDALDARVLNELARSNLKPATCYMPDDEEFALREHPRGVLTEAAWMAVSNVPVYSALFERVAERRGKAVAIVAGARRMLEDAVTMLWKEEAFRFVPVAPTTGTPRSDSSASTGSRPRSGQPSVDATVASSVAG